MVAGPLYYSMLAGITVWLQVSIERVSTRVVVVVVVVVAQPDSLPTLVRMPQA